MLFNDSKTQIMQKGLDALWLKQRVISSNIANYETPGYKTKSVEFQDVLNNAENSLDGKHILRTTITEDSNTSIRPDGNNVNIEQQSLELWKTYAQYSYLTQKISGHYSNLRYVINQAMK